MGDQHDVPGAVYSSGSSALVAPMAPWLIIQKSKKS
jgi:hypothetical protein